MRQDYYPDGDGHTRTHAYPNKQTKKNTHTHTRTARKYFTRSTHAHSIFPPSPATPSAPVVDDTPMQQLANFQQV